MTPDNRLERRWRRRLNLSGSRSTSPHNSSKPCRQSLHDDQHNSDHQQNSNSDSYLKENHYAKPQPDGVVDDDQENNCNFQERQTNDNFNDGDGDGDVDPDYKLFLDNLREFRKSYVLELAGFVVHYEEERSLHDGGEKVEEGVEKGDTGMVDKDYAKFLGWVEEREEVTPNFGDGSVMGGDFGRRREVEEEEELEEAVDYGMDGNDSVMVDKEYATFLDWIEEEVEEEKEVCSEGAVADGMCERAEDGGDVGENAGLADDVVEVDGMVSSESKLVEDGKNTGLVDDGVKVGGMVSGERNLVEDSEKWGLVDDEVEVDGMVSSERNLIEDGENAGGVDDGAKMDERVSSERKLVEGEDEDGDEPSCYIVEQDSHLDSFVDVDSGTSNVKSSRYRENLMDILKIPYDEKEYIVLKRDISIKKRMERHRELRNNSLKSCPIDRLGNSYLDSYPDVEKRMQEVPYDKHRALKIMRGFFYWLKNLTQDGAFQPWLDKSFLEGVSK